MKALKILLATAFLATTFSVHADADNATIQVATKNDGKGQMNAIMNINKVNSARLLKQAEKAK